MTKKLGTQAGRVKLLAFTACGTCEGDVNMLLLALQNLSRETFDVSAVSVPRGDVYDKLRRMAQTRVVGMDMGGLEARADGHAGPGRRSMEFFAAAFRIAQLVRREQMDVLYTLDRTVAPKIAALVSRITACPLVLWSAYPYYPRESRWNALVMRQARRVHVHSGFLRGHVAPYVSADALSIIPCGLQLENYDAEKSGQPARERLGIPAAAPLILLPGRLTPFKGHEDFVRAAAIVLAERPDAVFVMAGRDTTEAVFTHGPDATSFQAILTKQIADAGLSESVRLVGYYPDLPELIAAADVVTMPSWEEPFGLVALEGMAMGKPVVATRAGGVPEFVEDGRTGLLVPARQPAALAEAIVSLLKRPARARELGSAARRAVERSFTAEHYAGRVAETLTGAGSARQNLRKRTLAF